MSDPAIPRNGFLIPETEKCDRQIGQQKLTADRIYMYIYNPKTRKHEGQWVTNEDCEHFRNYVQASARPQRIQ